MPERKPSRPKAKTPPRFNMNPLLWAFVALTVLWVLSSMESPFNRGPQEIPYSELFNMVANDQTVTQIKSAVKREDIVQIELVSGGKFFANVPEGEQDLVRLLRDRVARFEIKPPKTLWLNLFYSLGPMLLLIGFWVFIGYRGAFGGGRLLSFGKSRAQQVSQDNIRVTFDDVAGVDEAKGELREIIEFLKDPKRFQRLGGKIPKGVLLMGPPGTGKTLLAKAVAGEAGVPFFSISGSDFVEMFVGVGASRVRDLFDQAKKSAKAGGKGCIIFIDEIDAVGRQRFAGIGGGHDEREQTLNALLVEMDGFNTQEGVVLMAATNRPDVLDPALLRPGRFDRQVVIDRPDVNGRESILKVHVRKIKLATTVDLKKIARQTPGFSGADLANLANEAALLAARRNLDAVGMPELEESIERVMAGPERKSRVISDREKLIVAYHESGHALLALLTPHVDPLHKVSIIPRGIAALGYTMQVPLEDRYIVTEQELQGRLTVLLGGRASEELIFRELTTGAQNDLEVASGIARRMVCEFGMSEKLGMPTLGRRENMVFLGRDLMEERNYSEQTAQMIDQEVRRIIDQAYHRAKDQLTTHMDQLKLLAETLREKEVLDGEEVKRIVGLATDAPSALDPGQSTAAPSATT